MERLGMWRSVAARFVYSDHKMVFRGGERTGQKVGSQPWTMGPRELVAIQRLSPPCSRMVHCDKQKIKQRQQAACMDEQEAPH